MMKIANRNSSINLVKYQSTGNDYLFLDSSRFRLPGHDGVKKICHRNFGIGADGILHGSKYSNGRFAVRIVNSDSSEAEISGNGMRIFSRAMFDLGHVALNETFTVKTIKKTVQCRVVSKKLVEVNMGIPSFDDGNIPQFRGGSAVLTVNGVAYEYFPVSIGNPHCVVFVHATSAEKAKSLGRSFETNFAFPNGANVEFAEIIDGNNIAVETWERGVGYTLACGSGACAVFAVANKLNFCSDSAKIHMPGGTIGVSISKCGSVSQIGSVERISSCDVEKSFLKCHVGEKRMPIRRASFAAASGLNFWLNGVKIRPLGEKNRPLGNASRWEISNSLDAPQTDLIDRVSVSSVAESFLRSCAKKNQTRI
jgi:diaminopimelate epimerase